ncbi:aminotransferase class I/II-fold pyridoxal phosphate-dependent enzyme [Pantoea agglomerans]|uniref:aminotransferase class I/II-fold pyridoxal phosphate-dependent enzyme n=1 Tax=Enterobacter agglomerans TaxID=549 RepID=UPI000DAB961E|nr:aminotransferase class I/II-fold pyridoxal phosphate-dependent enzyme [Pantoea agglomerans]RAH27282.1 transcriptional regulator PtsJ [Pantoea agglomerans]TGX89259.1 aminotransferase class I/II-fold pyridoxal phosphate-dependent enzyme [Pantoea agglomerans]
MTASEIFESVRQKVRTGRLMPGDALPPVRELAVRLGVHRNTVASAYKKLAAAGIAVTNGRYGTTITQAEDVTEQEGPASQTILTDVSGGNPEQSLLPDLLPLLQAVSLTPRSYGGSVINPGLEKAGREWFSRDVPGTFGLGLTHGATDAIERLVTGYLTAGEKIVVEEPCFLSSINAIRSLGYVPAGVPVDRHGLLPGPLQDALEAGAQVVIVTPRAHNPTGCRMSPERAPEIRAVLARFPHVMVIVDDHFSLLSGHDYQNVIADETRNWAIVRSVSKFYGPDLRLALIASNPDTAERLSRRMASGTHWVSHILQDMTEEALSSAAVAQKVREAAANYRSRRDFFLAALRARGVETAREYDGLNVWLPLCNEPAGLISLMKARGWLVRPGAGFYLSEPQHAIRLTPGSLSDEQSEILAQDLADALRDSGNSVSQI